MISPYTTFDNSSLRLLRRFFERFRERFHTADDYYSVHRCKVEFEGISPSIPELAGT